VRVVCRGEKRNACRVSVQKPEGKTLYGWLRCGWADNIKMYLKGIGWDGMEWIHVAQD
jgi:hypothetical protein